MYSKANHAKFSIRTLKSPVSKKLIAGGTNWVKGDTKRNITELMIAEKKIGEYDV